MALEDIERLKEKIDKDPDSKLFVPLAEEYKKAGMLDEAIEALSKGLDRQPTYLSARVSLGKIYIEKGMLNEARDEFEKVTQVIPDNLYAHKKLAEIFRDLGEHEKAIYEFKTVLKLNPADEWATSSLSTLENGPVQEIQEPFTERDIDLQPSPETEPLAAHEEEQPLSPELSSGQEETRPIEMSETEEHAPLEELRTEIAEDFETELEEPSPPSQEAPDMWEIPAEDTEPAMPEEPAAPFSLEQKEDLWGLQEDESVTTREEEEPFSLPSIEEEKNFWELSSEEGIEVKEAPEEPFPGEFPEAAPAELKESAATEVVAPEAAIHQPPSVQDADRFVSEENYHEALKIYSALLSNDPGNKALIQRVHELKSLLKLLGKDKEAMITELENLLEGINKRRDEFFRST